MKQLPKICALLGIALLLSTSFVWAQSNNGSAITSGSPVSPNKGQARRPTEILPDFQNAIRNDTYKLVQLLKPDCTQPYDDHGNFPDVTFTEFYQINEAAPIPMLDNANAALCSDNTTNTNSCPTGLTQDQLTNFNSLSFQMTQLLQSEVACPGDGNEDKVVNGQDLAFWRKFAELAMGGSSWYDFNLDGMTDPADLVIIKKNLGTKCLPKK